MSSPESVADDDVTTIARSQIKLILLVLAACAFVGLGIWLLLLDPAAIQAQRRFNSPLFVRGVGWATVVFFGICAVYATVKLFDDAPGLTFSRAGIWDNSSGVAAGLIPWADILGTDIFQMHGQKMLVILVRNPDEYAARGNRFKQALHRANIGLCGSPVVISPIALKTTFPELQAIFEQYYGKYGNAG